MNDIKTFVYIDEVWENVSPLNENETVWISINSLTHKVGIKKYMPLGKASLFEKLIDCDNRCLEKILVAVEGEDKGLIINEYISGETLDDILHDRGHLSESETKAYFVDILDGISALHQNGIIHRDIKPENIIITSDGIAKVIDFGISREKSENKNSDTTILGTVGYAAPEQFGFSQSDEKTDIYALGVLLNVMLTGHIPKDGVYDDMKMSHIIKRCIEIKPDDRYQSIKELNIAISGHTRQNSKPLEYPESIRRGTNPLWWLPGFRSMKWWKMMISVFIYAFMAFWTIECYRDVRGDFLQVLASSIFIVFHAIIVPLLMGNIAYWDCQVPYMQRLSPKERLVMRIIWGILFWLIGFALYLFSIGQLQM